MNRLKIKNTGDLFLLDKPDFDKAKHTAWFLNAQGELRNPQGITLESYCGIPGKRINTKTLNFSRENYA